MKYKNGNIILDLQSGRNATVSVVTTRQPHCQWLRWFRRGTSRSQPSHQFHQQDRVWPAIRWWRWTGEAAAYDVCLTDRWRGCRSDRICKQNSKFVNDRLYILINKTESINTSQWGRRVYRFHQLYLVWQAKGILQHTVWMFECMLSWYSALFCGTQM